MNLNLVKDLVKTNKKKSIDLEDSIYDDANDDLFNPTGPSHSSSLQLNNNTINCSQQKYGSLVSDAKSELLKLYEYQATLDKTDKRAAEMESLINAPFTFVRSKIREQVQDGFWLEDIKKVMKMLEGSEKDLRMSRCTICTLPYGTCVHTEQWITETHPEEDPRNKKLAVKEKSAADKEMDDIMGDMFTNELPIDSSVIYDDIDIDTMRWYELESRKSDKIGDKLMSLFLPESRGWHSTVAMADDRLVVVFGGFRYKLTAVPQPFGETPTAIDVEYLSDISIFDRRESSWHSMKPQKVRPQGRYGHVAASLDANRMIVFGGRGASGRLLNDTWIYNCKDDKWTNYKYDGATYPSPSARVFAAAAVDTNDLYMHGGTDGTENYGDMWIFRSAPNLMRWERTVVVGIPPSPRYGHRLVNIKPGEMVVLGGCCVSPQSEVLGNSLSVSETKKLLDLSNTLQNRYQAEGESADLSGKVLVSNILNDDKELRNLYKDSSKAAGRVASLEVSTRAAEQELVDTWQTSQALKHMSAQKARHPDLHLSVVFFHVYDMSWKAQIYPAIRGELPLSRIHFGAICIGNYIVLTGGGRPTSLKNSPVETPGNARIYCLDLTTMIWKQTTPVESADYFDMPLQIANADILNAQRRCEAEKLRGYSLGAKNGLTVEYREAESVLNVCKWRLNVLQKEFESSRTPPPPRFGCTLTKVNQRALYLGGWNEKRIVPKKDILVIDMENELEKRRRESDETTAKLERDRNDDEAQSFISNIQTAYELRFVLLKEKANEARERREMAVGEICSSVPPLTVPKPVRFVKSNSTTIWIEWDRVDTNADKYSIDPAKITYMIWMKNGFSRLAIEERVLVLPTKRIINPPAPNSSSTSSVTEDQISLGSIDEENFPICTYRGIGNSGEIAVNHGNGLFDIFYDDGTVEKNVPRWRIALEDPVERKYLGEKQNYNEKGFLLRNSDFIDDKMSLATKKRILRKNKIKSKSLNRLKVMNPKFESIIDARKKIQQISQEDFVTVIDKKDTKTKNKDLDFEDGLQIASILSSTTVSRPDSKAGDSTQLGAVFPLHGSKPGTADSSTPNSRPITSDSRPITSDSRPFIGIVANSLVDKSIDNEDIDGEDLRSEEQMKADIDAIRRGGIPSNVNLNAPGGPFITAKAGAEWHLVYIGNDNNYAVTDIVPLETIQNEPGLVVACSFCVQTIGREFPPYEHSIMSDESTFFTTTPELNLITNSLYEPSMITDNLNSFNPNESIGFGESTLSPTSIKSPSKTFEPTIISSASKGTATYSTNISAKTKNNDKTNLTEGITTLNSESMGMSKLKKEFITAVIKDNDFRRVVYIEKEADSFVCEGISDEYI